MLRQVCSLPTLSYATVVMAVLVSSIGTAAGLPVCNVTVALSDVHDVRNCTWPTAPSGRLVAVNASWSFLGVVFPGVLRTEAALLLASGARVVMDSCVNVTVAFANYTNITLRVNSSSVSVRYRSLRNSMIEEPLADIEGNLSVAITNCSVTGPLLMIEGTGSEKVLNVSLFMSSSSVYCDDTMDIEDQCFLLRLENLSLASGVTCALESVTYHTAGSMDTTAVVLETIQHVRSITAWLTASTVMVELGSKSSDTNSDAVIALFMVFVASIAEDLMIEVVSSRVAVVCNSTGRPYLWKSSSYLIRLGPADKSQQRVALHDNSTVSLRVADSQLRLASVMRSVVFDMRKVNLVSVRTRLSVTITNTSAELLAYCRGNYSLNATDLNLEANSAREATVAHLACEQCSHVYLNVSGVAVESSIALDNAPNQSSAVLGPLGGGAVQLSLTSASTIVQLTGVVKGAAVHVFNCSLNLTIIQKSHSPVAFLSHASLTAAVFLSSSVDMVSLTLCTVNCTVTRRSSVTVRLLTDAEKSAIKDFIIYLTRNNNTAASESSGEGAFSSVVAVLLSGITCCTSPQQTLVGNMISVMHSHLVVPSNSSVNGSAGEWAAPVVLAPIGDVLYRIGQTNEFVRQVFASFVIARGYERHNASTSGHLITNRSVIDIRDVSFSCSGSIIPSASVRSDISVLLAVIIVFNTSIHEASILAVGLNLVGESNNFTRTACVIFTESALLNATLFVGDATSSISFSNALPMLSYGVNTLSVFFENSHMLQGSRMTLHAHSFLSLGCDNKKSCGYDGVDRLRLFALVMWAGNASSLSNATISFNNAKIVSPPALFGNTSTVAAVLLLLDYPKVGAGVFVDVNCSTWDGVLLVDDVASRRAVVNGSSAASLSSVVLHAFCSATLPISFSPTLHAATATSSIFFPSESFEGTSLTTTLYSPAKMTVTAQQNRAAVSPQGDVLGAVPTSISVASAAGIGAAVVVDPSAAADLQLLAGLLGSPCLQRGGSDESISRYLLSPFADVDSHIAIVLGNIALVVAVLAAQGAAASYFARSEASCSWRVVLSALTEIRTAAKNAAVVRAQLPNWAVHAALFLLPGVAQGAVLSMSTGAAGTIVGGGVVGAAWIVCILAVVFPLWLGQIEAGKLAVFTRYPYAAEAVVRAPASRYSDAKRSELRTVTPSSDSAQATPYGLPRWLLPMGTWGPDAVRTSWGKVFAAARPPWMRWVHADCVLKTACLMVASVPDGSSSSGCAAAFGVVAAVSYGVAVVLLVMQPLRCTTSSVLRGLCSAANGTVASLLAALILYPSNERLQESFSAVSVALSILSVLSTLHTIMVALLSRGGLNTQNTCSDPSLFPLNAVNSSNAATQSDCSSPSSSDADSNAATLFVPTTSAIASLSLKQLEEESGVVLSRTTRDSHPRCEKGIAKQPIAPLLWERRDIRWLLMIWSLRRPDSCEEQVSRLGVMLDVASFSKKGSRD